MKMIAENDWGPVLVVEDDCNFYCDDEHILQANLFLSALQKREWDVALLGGNYYNVYEHEADICSLSLKYAYCANAYIVNRGYAEKMMHIFDKSVQKHPPERMFHNSIIYYIAVWLCLNVITISFSVNNRY
ncbi:TPA: hypothetical protein OTO75_001656 [Morganella morganii]|nr:hypothetical protein [Morganella morganii]EMP52021.1 hypothetical protein C790_00491 [Morganella morganii SC01]MBT0404955.1 hypothetical protein [Morganella morganii subsp. morganii]ATF52466.1 hypothetical protein CO693_01485 [Morganella morganii]AVK35289.1 LPS glycosyltransferase family domain protein [Morganella morganii]EKU4001054.1 hypothetical protein [Morganella morganii]